jgi:hypothetical protein
MYRHSHRPQGILSLALARRGLAPTRVEHEVHVSAPSRLVSATAWLSAVVLVIGVIGLAVFGTMA